MDQWHIVYSLLSKIKHVSATREINVDRTDVPV